MLGFVFLVVRFSLIPEAKAFLQTLLLMIITESGTAFRLNNVNVVDKF